MKESRISAQGPGLVFKCTCVSVFVLPLVFFCVVMCLNTLTSKYESMPQFRDGEAKESHTLVRPDVELLISRQYLYQSRGRTSRRKIFSTEGRKRVKVFDRPQ